MMKNDSAAFNVAKGAAISSLTAIAVWPQHPFPNLELPQVTVRYEARAFDPSLQIESKTVQDTSTPSPVFENRSPERKWTKIMEREFCELAMAEANEKINDEQMARLEDLSRIRDHFQEPRSPQEILLQIRSDRILEKLTDTLRACIAFDEWKTKTGKSSS
jgi:hypothetical protein